MKLLQKKDNEIIFSAEINESLANAVRRYLNEISVLAIDMAEISKNDSPLYDETIAHRLSLIPLDMGKTGDEKTPKIKLNVKKEGTVYSVELTGNIKPVYEKIPITTLKKGQEINIIATTKFGKGSEHSKFSPGLMFYRNLVDVNVDGNCPNQVVETCPQNILELKDNKIVVNADKVSKCDMCEACLEACKKQGKDSIKLNPTGKLIITIESFGQLGTKDIFKESINVLKKDLVEVAKKVGK